MNALAPMSPFSNWPLLAALLFIAMGVGYVHQSWQKLRRWPRVEGVVVALIRVTVSKNPEIEYKDAAGVAHRFVSRMPYHQRLKIGDKLMVAVNPDNPAEAERVNFLTAVLMPAMMVAFGIIVVLFHFGLTK